jgi:ATP synthase protein I
MSGRIHAPGTLGSVSHTISATAIVPAQMSHSSSDRKGAGRPVSPGSPRRAGDTAGPAAPGSSLQDPYSIIAYLLSGAIVFGGIGWLVDRWLGTQFIVAIGLMLGVALSLYLVNVRLNTPAGADPASVRRTKEKP